MTERVPGGGPPSVSLSPEQHHPQPIVPAEIRALLGPAPITSLEDGDAYERLLSQFALAI